jgi:hypothetical protein
VNQVYGPVDPKQPGPPWTSVIAVVVTSSEACAPVATGTGGGRGARERGRWVWGTQFGSHRRTGGGVVGGQR